MNRENNWQICLDVLSLSKMCHCYAIKTFFKSSMPLSSRKPHFPPFSRYSCFNSSFLILTIESFLSTCSPACLMQRDENGFEAIFLFSLIRYFLSRLKRLCRCFSLLVKYMLLFWTLKKTLTFIVGNLYYTIEPLTYCFSNKKKMAL